VDAAAEIVAATRAHVAAIFAMVRELADYEKLTHLVTGTEVDLERDLFGGRPVIEAIVAAQAGAPVGYALYFHTYSTFLTRRGLWLEDIYVKPAARGKGIGQALLKRVASIAAERGCARFEWSVLDWNQSAIDFYQHLGATIMADWRIARVTGPALTQLADR
jgi:GNAT superfamily N-acetyltransferase